MWLAQNNMRSNHSGFVLISSLLIIIVLALVGTAVFMRSDIEFRALGQRIDKQDAFFAAEAGLDFAIAELRKNIEWNPGEDGQDPISDVPLNVIPDDDDSKIGFYSIKVADGGKLENWDTRWVQSTGKDKNQKISKVILARVIVENPARFLVSTLGDLRVASGASIASDILGRDIYFDINTALPEEEQDIQINGDVFYIRDIFGEDHEKVNIDGEVGQSPSVTFSGVDSAFYKTQAINLQEIGQSYYSEGDLTVNLDNLEALTSGGNENFEPLIIFAEGDITIYGEYSHSLTIVTNGNIIIGGDVVANKDLPELIPQIGLYANQDVIIPADLNLQSSDGDLNIEAFVVADGAGPDSEGTFLAENTSNQRNTLNFSGSISARGESGTAVNLDEFGTRNYSYNSELNTNLTIPFSTFIANLAQWNEVTIQEQFPPLE